MTAPAIRVERHAQLSRPVVDEVSRIARAATEADGVAPLSEQVLLHLRRAPDPAGLHLLAYTADDRLTGYLHLDTDPIAGTTAEMVVDPSARQRGVASALVQAVLSDVPTGSLRLWAHGQHTGAAKLAERHGFTRSRELWQLRRPLTTALPPAALPAGVSVRTFEPGRDEAAWLEVNNAAFATHPEQGGWTDDDIVAREGESWFDPAGFFLAERDGRVIGFHWTKVHPAGESGGGAGALGEVYVVGVHPDVGAQGLGSALTLIGLRWLRSRGLPEAMLYVDATNGPALTVYQRLGFTSYDVDVTYSRT